MSAGKSCVYPGLYVGAYTPKRGHEGIPYLINQISN